MKFTFTLIALVCLTVISNAQADLILSNLTAKPVTLRKGDYLSFSFRIKNTGKAIANTSHISVYICPAQSLTGAIGLNTISVESLQPNQETEDMQYVFPIPFNTSAGGNYLLFNIDAKNELIGENKSNNLSSSANKIVTVSNVYGNQQNIPYPIIMVHGLSSDNTTWDSLIHSLQNYYGWSFGGIMDFCLNEDGDATKSDTTNQSDYRDWTNEANIYPADVYTVNFNTDPNGNTDIGGLFKSNQSSIVKQGMAIRDAVKHVLKITGRDKVILLCHSMGGLASRQYLQNSSMWQLDGQHHVAKLATIGTPHGGSNSTSFGLPLGGVDEKSEAVRDLRYRYDISLDPGVFLFGGKESLSTMINSLISNYDNVDVNCNGINGDGLSITGLNQFPTIVSDLDYSCMIGTGSALGGDGVVDEERANLNNYYNVNSDTFICKEPISIDPIWHTKLTQQIPFILQALDEPKYSNLGYHVSFGQYYFGNFTLQSLGSSIDNDIYSFIVPSKGNLTVQLYNIPVSNCLVNIYNNANVLIYPANSDSKGYLSFTKALDPGQYILDISGIADNLSWLSPYGFKLTFKASLPVSLLDFAASNMGKYVGLKWQTTNEEDTKQFVIERSINGNAWDSIGMVSAKNITGINDYSFNDYGILKGTIYYHLRMVDRDGRFTYSPVRSVTFSQSFLVSPNPARNYATVYFGESFNGQLSVYDVAGKQVLTTTVKGQNSYQINTAMLPAGVYIITVNDGATPFKQKLVITK